MIPALILAAGASSRMGRTKALLRVPPHDVFLSRIEKTLRLAGVEEIVAVIGHDVDRIRGAVAGWTGDRDRDAAIGSPLRLVVNPHPERGQLSSLVVGLEAVLAGRGQAGVPGILVTTVDLPLVSVRTVERVLAEWDRSKAAIVRPSRGDRHGHPVVFSAALFDELRAADPAVGARAVVRSHQADTRDVAVDDAGAFEDIDTPEDYRRMVLGE